MTIIFPFSYSPVTAETRGVMDDTVQMGHMNTLTGSENIFKLWKKDDL